MPAPSSGDISRATPGGDCAVTTAGLPGALTMGLCFVLVAAARTDGVGPGLVRSIPERALESNIVGALVIR